MILKECRAEPDVSTQGHSAVSQRKLPVRLSSTSTTCLDFLIVVFAPVMDYMNAGFDALQSRLAWVATEKFGSLSSSWAVCLSCTSFHICLISSKMVAEVL